MTAGFFAWFINDRLEAFCFDAKAHVIDAAEVNTNKIAYQYDHGDNATGFDSGEVGQSRSKVDEDEDSDSSKTTMSYKDRRRTAHTVAEQKRRDAIKKGYDELLAIVPTCHQQDALGSQKMSKATVLQRSIDYMQFLTNQKKKQEEDLDSLRKEVMALKIMKANYEHIVKTHQNTPVHGQNQVSDEVKFQVFQQIMDTLFQSFNSSISVANFAELSACVFSWLEEYCKPQTLREVVLGILRQLNTQLSPGHQ
ncbi:hypothetical protein C0Q70_04171 [Pomacea canaliculata]|uniref:Max-like protein X n=1 Tax=Pomacea canaliculata TaxID=400727 RepID=A0A2T7PUR8_POMCA|nr:hypothetical protein C0Q70_04171 [Pomacea canaliculata]